MILFLAAAALASQTPVPAVSNCLGVVVQTGPDTQVLFVSFMVAGTEPQLAAIRKEAMSIGAVVKEPKKIDGILVLPVFFEGSVRPADAIALYNRIDRGEFHPGLSPQSIRLQQMTLPANSCNK